MPWSTTSDIDAFVAAAGEFLGSRPIAHSPLLTEADYLSRRPQPGADQAYGWWADDSGGVAGAFLRAPRHATLLTPMPDAAVDELVQAHDALEVIDINRGLGCDVTTVDALVAACGAAGRPVVRRHRITVHRLDTRHPHHPRPPAPGRARTAGPADARRLDDWFDALMAAHPGDPSDRAYVVSDPLADGRITLWEVEGAPVAMAGRTPVLSGMTRLSAVFAPSGDAGLKTAVLGAATEAAAAVAADVLFLAGTDDHEAGARLAALGYRAVGERVLLAPVE